jgi:hypothetical protein
MAISRFAASRVTQGLPKYQSAWDQDGVEQGAMVGIASANDGSANFSSIPQTYKDLYVTGVFRGSTANTIEYANLVINGSTSNVYSFTHLTGDGSVTSTGRNFYTGATYLGNMAGNNATANLFSAYEIWILDYANTSHTKTYLWRLSGDANGSGVTVIGTGQFFQNAAVTSVNIYGSNGTAIGTRHSLYGIGRVGQ